MHWTTLHAAACLPSARWAVADLSVALLSQGANVAASRIAPQPTEAATVLLPVRVGPKLAVVVASFFPRLRRVSEEEPMVALAGAEVALLVELLPPQVLGLVGQGWRLLEEGQVAEGRVVQVAAWGWLALSFC
mmetsp:Transcript_24327/g.56500  ORF Transcript_24327/g.56500 Transcript_24327/m.56500 type:complete len:133 (-) Transcript_24327:243-641(-)